MIAKTPKLDYRQTDNINHFFYFIRQAGLPEVSHVAFFLQGVSVALISA